MSEADKKILDSDETETVEVVIAQEEHGIVHAPNECSKIVTLDSSDKGLIVKSELQDGRENTSFHNQKEVRDPGKYFQGSKAMAEKKRNDIDCIKAVTERAEEEKRIKAGQRKANADEESLTIISLTNTWLCEHRWCTKCRIDYNFLGRFRIFRN